MSPTRSTNLATARLLRYKPGVDRRQDRASMIFRPCPPPRVHTLRGAFFLMPILALLAPLGLAPLALLTAVLLLATTPRPWRWPPLHLTALLMLTPLLAGLSAAWSQDPPLSLKAAGQIAAIAIAIVALSVGARSADCRPAAAAALTGVDSGRAVLVIDRLVGNKLIGLVHGMNFDAMAWETFAQASTKRGTTVIAVLTWPLVAAFIASGRRTLAALALALGGGCVLAGYSSTAVVALLAGLPALALFQFAGRRAGWAASAVLALAVLAAPWAVRQLPPPQRLWDAQPWIPNSAHHRLTIWRFTADRTAERPVLGWGMDASRIMPGGDDAIKVGRIVDGRKWEMFEQMLPLHPHNAFLQWWLELGLAGAAAMTALAGALIAATARLPVPRRGLVMAGLTSALVCAASAFGAWQSWWLLSLGLAALLGAGRFEKDGAR